MKIHDHPAVKGGLAVALAVGTAAVIGSVISSARDTPPTAAPPADDRCATMFAAAAELAAARHGVRIERPVHDASSPNPDALVFPSADALEASAELVPRALRSPSALLDDQVPDPRGWIHAAYEADGFITSLDERHDGAWVVRVEAWVRAGDTGRRWDAIADGIRDELQRAGDRCLAARQSH